MKTRNQDGLLNSKSSLQTQWEVSTFTISSPFPLLFLIFLLLFSSLPKREIVVTHQSTRDRTIKFLYFTIPNLISLKKRADGQE